MNPSDADMSWLHTIFQSMPLGAVIRNADGQIIAANPAACQILGMDFEELARSASSSDGYSWQVIDEFRQPLSAAEHPARMALTSGQPIRDRIIGLINPPDGMMRWLLVNAIPECLPGETLPHRVCVLFKDITVRRQAQERWKDAENRFQALFEHSPIGVSHNRMVYDASGNAQNYEVLDVNQNYIQMTGVDARGKLITEAFPGIQNDPFDWIGKFAKVVRTGESMRCQQNFIVNNRWYDCVGYRTGPDTFGVAFLEITEQKRTELALSASEENLRITLGSIGDAVIATDVSGAITCMNPVAERLTGWSFVEAKGRPLTKVFRIVNSLTRVTCENPVELVLATGQVVGLANHTVLISRQGAERQIADSGAPIRNDQGQIVGVVLVFRDVTDEYLVRDQLAQARKLDALGQLAGGVAHDFNNMLAGIINATELLRLRIDDVAKRERLLEIIQSASERAADLTKKLLAFARKGHVTTAPLHLHEALTNAMALLEHSIDKRIVISSSLQATHDVMEGDLSALQSIFLNLGINSAHAMSDGGELFYSTSTVQLESTDPRISAFELPAGPFIEIMVRDTGTGIAPELMSRIFDPFFTTKGPGQGTGLGLTAAYGTVRQHHGAINVISEMGKGTTFRILLPLSTTTQSHPKQIKIPPMVGHGRILLVDDEALVRDTARMILEHYGYEVVEAINGTDALRRFTAEPNGFALVILDMIMPVMDGRTCCEQLRVINPKVRVLLCSGYSQEQDLAALQASGVTKLLRKPFRETELATAVAEMLI